MEYSNYLWSTLLEKYLRKEINEHELKALEHYINTCPIKMRQFKEWTDPQELPHQLQFYKSIDTDMLWEQVEAKISAVNAAKPKPVKNKVAIIKKIFAIIVAGGSTVAAVYFLFLRKPHPSPEIAKTITVLAPEIKNNTYLRESSGFEYNLEEDNTTSLGVLTGNLMYQNNMLTVNTAAGDNSTDNKHFDLVTAPQKQMQLQLADKSLVQLSSSSAIRFPLKFKKTKREVQLSGQAYFNIKTNKEVPFVVTLTNGLQVQAVGTSFNITSYDAGRIIVTLISGTVKMTYGKLEIVVNEGQQVEFTTENKFRFIEQPNVNQAMAWINYEFDFTNKDIKDVISEIGNYYNYKVIFKDALPPLAASGIFDIKKNNLTKILSAIKQLHEVDITPEGNTLIVRKTTHANNQ